MGAKRFPEPLAEHEGGAGPGRGNPPAVEPVG